CLPEDKVRTVQEQLQKGHRVLMVGDGINDAPALATATVGMALGSQGLTAAATAADTVLLSTDILRVVRAVRVGRHVMRVAIQGIWVGMGLSVIAMIFAAFGLIIPAAGAILQEAIDVVVILNALRAGRIKF
ncbi:MAG TPA: HAD-IC family P-type ATPase, partial [Ktedonobacteraceae bacterium]|nr:HAD-IC family P-type ATPase [Ktedonobacteraceae bacterium]